jgi:hypothetical protein
MLRYPDNERFHPLPIAIDTNDCKLCHGFPLLQHSDLGHPKGTPFGHGWVEYGNLVIVAAPFDDTRRTAELIYLPHYYEAGQIDPKTVVKYGRQHMMMLAVEYGVVGHWDASRAPSNAVFSDRDGNPIDINDNPLPKYHEKTAV